MSSLKRAASHAIEDFATVIRHCAKSKDLAKGRWIHNQIISDQKEYRENVFLPNFLVQMYGKCSSPNDAKRVFDAIDAKNVFSWAVMITAYTQNGYLQDAKLIFDEMPHGIQCLEHSEGILASPGFFRKVPQHDTISATAMVPAFAARGNDREACALFENMPERNVFSWTALLQGYAENRLLDKAKSYFDKMPAWNLVSWTVLVISYAQCERLEIAQDLFVEMPERSIVTWNALLAAIGHA
ncbi:pentatricopeptide repeat-containing protein At4g02750-like [Selaginella moellendorffii]|uniref:pentatricopeptide repeat-containing protein At4g02750-like n=1 Tax=Selaginella moellendorffii TaxID=88036 RepID=UPI000D1CD041|nr:pentatricopeptide repeat-containing protein At4g02750-like [Selaginella moellendorffii]|eukprot:XP_024541023.1 pentatricopeptide repeat-containing protein At4g02750-like [Selaginella moellendorffii]